MKKILALLVCVLCLCGCEKDRIIEPIFDSQERGHEMKIEINHQVYPVALENNDTVMALYNLLPLEVNMSELNGNEKYVYLSEKLPVNEKKVGRVHKGDVMLYQDNCLVLFYKDFETPYSYTKIGSIQGLTDLGKESISIKIHK